MELAAANEGKEEMGKGRSQADFFHLTFDINWQLSRSHSNGKQDSSSLLHRFIYVKYQPEMSPHLCNVMRVLSRKK